MAQERKDSRLAVFALFNDRMSVESAVNMLKIERFRNSDISVLMPDKQSTKEFAHEKSTKAPEGAAAGGVSGAALGGALGWLVGAGTLAIPGIGALVAVGPIISTLVGVGVGGAVGGLTGALIGMGMPEYEAKRYATSVKEGGILLSVHVDDDEWKEKAEDILERCGGTDMSTTHEKKVDISKVDIEKRATTDRDTSRNVF